MKKIIVAVLVAVLLTSGLLVGCGGVVVGSGKLATQEFNFSDFKRVDVSSAFEVEIAQSGSYHVSVTADDNLFEYIEVSKEGETLKIGLKTVTNLGPATLKAQITMPQLSGLILSGASKGSVSSFSSTEQVPWTWRTCQLAMLTLTYLGLARLPVT